MLAAINDGAVDVGVGLLLDVDVDILLGEIVGGKIDRGVAWVGWGGERDVPSKCEASKDFRFAEVGFEGLGPLG